MPTNRRQFIKQSAGMVSLSFVMPSILLREARGQAADPNRRIFVVVQLAGGNDGLNTVIPYTDARYASLRPTLALKESDLVSDDGTSTVISDRLGLHPSLSKIKTLYDAGKVGIVLGVGYTGADLSHFTSMDVWHTGDLRGSGNGWLGKYADLTLAGRQLAAASISSPQIFATSLPRSLRASNVVIPNLKDLQTYGFRTDPNNASTRRKQLTAFEASYRRNGQTGGFFDTVVNTGLSAVEDTKRLEERLGGYTPAATYPDNNSLAAALKTAAQLAVTSPEITLLYVQMGGFDSHARQIESATNRKLGIHATLLKTFSEAVSAFYQDMAGHGLADKTVILQWSEFGRRVPENGSLGTDHGTAGPMFVIGDPVRGGLYGQQPSLEATALDAGDNLRFAVDFRSVYATILDRWLKIDSRLILGEQFENVGFLA